MRRTARVSDGALRRPRTTAIENRHDARKGSSRDRADERAREGGGRPAGVAPFPRVGSNAGDMERREARAGGRARGKLGPRARRATPRSARRVACVTRGEIRERYREVLYAPATSKQHIATSCSEVLGTFTLLKTRSCEAGGGGNGMRDARGRSA
jgi:hypothetical protein